MWEQSNSFRIHFAIENKISDEQNNEFTPKRELKVEVKAIASQYINGSRKSNLPSHRVMRF